MQLKNNISTETNWEIIETAFDPEQIMTTGSNFMIGNGYLGYRGTLAEWDADRYVACIVTDTWDTAERWTELCNVPNGLFTQLYVDDERLDVERGTTTDYRRELNLQHGIFRRRQRWYGQAQKPVQLHVERFASFENVHLLVMRYRIKAEANLRLTVYTGIDGRIWSINGEHFRSYDVKQDAELIGMETITGELGTQIDVLERLDVTGTAPSSTEVVGSNQRILRELTFDLAAGDDIILEKRVAIYSSNDVTTPYDAAATLARDTRDYETIKAAHQAAWDHIWQYSDIRIDGYNETQLLTRFNLYHNVIATPTHAPLPIGARGLSCQVYQGAAFWDQEIFNLPMFIYTQPEVARNVLIYRYNTLDGARRKAQRLGYYGAFYAWTSGKTGDELFPDVFFTDVLTGRPIHNHFNEWQIHISPDIVYTLLDYYQATDDWDFVINYGAEMAFEVAQFIVSRIHFKKDKNRYELIRLIGPDEYHENVDNDAFTNYQVRFALETAVAFYEMMASEAEDRLVTLLNKLGLTEADMLNWQEIADLIYLPEPDAETGVIQQFDGYFQLEDITPDKLRERLINENEYWGWPAGIAVETQVLKQADVLQLLALHDDMFDRDVIRTNFDYYEPRTEHGSSLSPSVHSQIAVIAGYRERALDFFHKGATVDLYNASNKVVSGGTFLGGIHTAACGAVWSMLVRGFAGFRDQGDGVSFSPTLPGEWNGLAFQVVVRDARLSVEITNTTTSVTAHTDNADAITVTVYQQTRTLAPGETTKFTT